MNAKLYILTVISLGVFSVFPMHVSLPMNNDQVDEYADNHVDERRLDNFAREFFRPDIALQLMRESVRSRCKALLKQIIRNPSMVHREAPDEVYEYPILEEIRESIVTYCEEVTRSRPLQEARQSSAFIIASRRLLQEERKNSAIINAARRLLSIVERQEQMPGPIVLLTVLLWNSLACCGLS